jgi:hypothetical protein
VGIATIAPFHSTLLQPPSKVPIASGGDVCQRDRYPSGQNADEPQYPQRFSALGIRIGINYIIYAMTH